MSRVNLLWGGEQALATSQAGQSEYLVPAVGGTMGQRVCPLPLAPGGTAAAHIRLPGQCYKDTPLAVAGLICVLKHRIQNNAHSVSSTTLTIHRRRETLSKTVVISK